MIAIVFAVLVAIYLQSRVQSTDSTSGGIQPTVGSLREVIIAKGIVSYDHQVLMRTGSAGIVKDIYVQEGQEIKRGQPLLRIKDHQSETELNVKNIELRASHTKLESLADEMRVYKQLVAAGGLSRRDLEQKKLEHDLAVADQERIVMEISQIVRKREQLLLTSPVDGLVVSMPLVLGQLVGLGDEAISLSGGDSRTIVAYIDALDVDRIGIGQNVSFSEQEDVEVKRKGRIQSISKFTSSTQNQNSVKVVVESTGSINDLRLSQQLYMEIIVREESSALRVPKDLVYDKKGQKIVYVSTHSGIEEREVRTEDGDATYDKVISGIDVNDYLVRAPAQGTKNL